MGKTDDFIRGLQLPAEARIYCVGGSVRDRLLGLRPHDSDYVVTRASLSALRASVLRAGGQASSISLRDGTEVGVRASFLWNGHRLHAEICVPRTERSTGPSRQNFHIVVDPDLPLREDARRRDFTVNALYQDLTTKEIVDPLGSGRDDLSTKRLRTTSEHSFVDDPLRILRAARFIATHRGFSLGADTYEQMKNSAGSVSALTQKGVSGTALTELTKLIMGRRCAKALRILRDTGALGVLIPELAPIFGFDQNSRYHDLTVDEHTFTALDAATKLDLPLRVRLALLFHDSGKPAAAWTDEQGRTHFYAKDETGEDHAVIGARLADQALTRLNTPKRLRRDVVTLVERHMVNVHSRTSPSKVRRWRVELGDGLLRDLFQHRLADVLGKGTIDSDQLSKLARLEQIRSDAQEAGVPCSVNELALSGREIMDMCAIGPEIGKIQRQLLHEVVCNPKLNDHDWLACRARKLIVRSR